MYVYAWVRVYDKTDAAYEMQNEISYFLIAFIR